MRGIHRGPVNSPHKWPVTRKMFPFDDVIMFFHGRQEPVTESYIFSTRDCRCHMSRLLTWINTLRPRQNGRRFADDTFKRIFLNENVRISIKISLKFVPKGPINNIPALVQIMAWRRSGDKPLSEPVMVRLLTYICVTRLQWVNFIRSIDESGMK